MFPHSRLLVEMAQIREELCLVDRPTLSPLNPFSRLWGRRMSVNREETSLLPSFLPHPAPSLVTISACRTPIGVYPNLVPPFLPQSQLYPLVPLISLLIQLSVRSSQCFSSSRDSTRRILLLLQFAVFYLSSDQ